MTSALSVIFMLTSKVALIALAIIMAKFVTKRLKTKKLDHFLLKIHRKVAYVLLVSVITHAALALCTLTAAPITAYIAGFISLFAIALAIKTFMSRKTISIKWQHYHRAAATLAVITLALHLVLRA